MSTTGPVIRAQYLETEEYFLEVWDRNPRKAGSIRFVIIAAGAIAIGVMLLDKYVGQHGFWWGPPAAGLLAALCVVYFCLPQGHRRHFRRSIRKQLANPPAQSSFEFTDAGIRWTGADGRSVFSPWSIVPQVVQLPDGLVVCFERSYYWVPQRAFASPEDYATASTIAETNAKQYQRGAPTEPPL